MVAVTGYTVQRTVYKLGFADGPLTGATIRAKSVSTGEYLRIKDLAAEAAQGRREEAAHNHALFDAFAAALVDWDLVDEDGTPIPADRDGLNRLDLAVSLELAICWLETIASAPPPLSNGSASGGSSLELSMPMAGPSNAPGS